MFDQKNTMALYKKEVQLLRFSWEKFDALFQMSEKKTQYLWNDSKFKC